MRGSSFGALLRKYRNAAGLSQEELAERSGLGVRTISDLERGRTKRPYRGSVELLCRALSLDPPTSQELMRIARGAALVTSSTSAAPNRATMVGPAVPPKVPAPVPRQLPTPGGIFVGRAAELAALTQLTDDTLDAGDTALIAAIDGTAGVGKPASGKLTQS